MALPAWMFGTSGTMFVSAVPPVVDLNFQHSAQPSHQPTIGLCSFDSPSRMITPIDQGYNPRHNPDDTAVLTSVAIPRHHACTPGTLDTSFSRLG